MMRDLRVLLFGAVLMVVGCTPTEEPIDDGDTDTATGSDIDPDQQINFPDSVLRACIEKLVGKGSGDPIYAKDVANITKVDCSGVSDLTGMEYFVNILTVVFYDSELNSLTQLAKLSTITIVHVGGGGNKTLNDIKDLKNIKNILYENSELEDISALVGKEDLTTANIYGNKIKDLSALALLPNIEKIDVSDNPTLTTLGAQFTAPKLVTLNVGNCALTSLNELSGLPELADINAQYNYLTEVSVIHSLPKLKGLGVKGNCLTSEAIDDYVAWYNTVSTVTTSHDEIVALQEYDRCQ